MMRSRPRVPSQSDSRTALAAPASAATTGAMSTMRLATASWRRSVSGLYPRAKADSVCWCACFSKAQRRATTFQSLRPR